MLGARFFLVRENGAYVPLVPADELPRKLDIVGVPRSLDMWELAGMTSVGHVPSSNHTYAVKIQELIQESSSGNKPATMALMGRGEFMGPNDVNPFMPIIHPNFNYENGSEWMPPSPTHVKREHGLQATINTIASGSLPAQGNEFGYNNSGVGHNFGARRYYCVYWLKTGFCAYQPGCLFEHKIPTSFATLTKLGLREIPQWWLHDRAAAHVSHHVEMPAPNAPPTNTFKPAGAFPNTGRPISTSTYGRSQNALMSKDRKPLTTETKGKNHGPICPPTPLLATYTPASSSATTASNVTPFTYEGCVGTAGGEGPSKMETLFEDGEDIGAHIDFSNLDS